MNGVIVPLIGVNKHSITPINEWLPYLAALGFLIVQRMNSPETLCGDARAKVLTALLPRGWIKPGDGGYLLTDAGYAAIGQ